MKLISVYIPDEYCARLDKVGVALAGLLHMPALTRSDVIRIALSHGLDSIDRDLAAERAGHKPTAATHQA